ncbi:hypothetical protein HI850_012100 [bacterium SPL81]|nr:hypothetical protein [Acinetobacter baumannii]
MKNKILFILTTVLFAGCQLTDQQAHQQQEVCKTLSQGYLKIQNQPTYELWKLEHIPTKDQKDTLKLTYKKPNENGVVLTGTLLPTVVLECSLQQQHIVVSLVQATGEPTPVLEVQLPNQTIGTLKNRELIAQTETR